MKIMILCYTESCKYTRYLTLREVVQWTGDLHFKAMDTKVAVSLNGINTFVITILARHDCAHTCC